MTKAEQTKQFIVAKTAPIFNKKGFAGTTMQDITAATGLTKGSIYGNFVNKDDVALAVFEHNISALREGMNKMVQDGGNSIEKLMNMVAYYRLEQKNIMLEGGCPVLNTAIDADDTHPQLRARVSRSIKLWKIDIENIVEEGIADKSIKPGIEAGKFANIFIALIEGGIMLAKATGDNNLLNTCLDRIETIINHELKC